MKTILFSIIIGILTILPVSGQNIDAMLVKVESAIAGGNASGLSVFLNSTVEISLPDKDETFSSTQAQFVLKDFFSKNPPKSFKIIHKGSSGNTYYAVGTYTSVKGIFDTNIFIKQVGDKLMIHQLRFEKEN